MSTPNYYIDRLRIETCLCYKYEFKDTKVVIRIRKSKKNRQHNGQKKRDKRTNNYPQNMQLKIKLTLYEDTKGVIRIRILKNRQHNGQKKKYKRTNNDLR